MLKSILIIGSSGKLGSVLSRKLKEAGYNVLGLDINQPSLAATDEFILADITAPDSLTALSACRFDALIIATPWAVAEAVINHLIIPYGNNRLVIDFLSEKYFFEQRIKKSVAGVQHIGVHTLFAPSVDWKNQNILVTPRNISDARALEFVRQLEAWGAVINYCDAIEHDRLMGFVQVGVHAAVIAYAQFLIDEEADFKLLNEISTPASRIMWAMAARIIGNDPSIYWEIQTNNAAAQDARNHLANAVRKIDRLIQSGDKSSFDAIFDKLRVMFGEDLGKYQRLANELFNHQISDD